VTFVVIARDPPTLASRAAAGRNRATLLLYCTASNPLFGSRKNRRSAVAQRTTISGTRRQHVVTRAAHDIRPIKNPAASSKLRAQIRFSHFDVYHIGRNYARIIDRIIDAFSIKRGLAGSREGSPGDDFSRAG